MSPIPAAAIFNTDTFSMLCLITWDVGCTVILGAAMDEKFTFHSVH